MHNLTDSHAHLDRDEYDADRDTMFLRAREAGVQRMLNVALGPEVAHFERAAKLAESHDGMYVAFGVHPHDADRMTDATLVDLRAWCRHPKAVAVGEIGLDFFYNHSKRDAQVHRFHQMLDLAIEIGKPISIHSRDAFEETLAAVASRDVFRKVGGVLHCFTGDVAQAAQYVALGAYISLSGIVTFKKAEGLRDVARSVPLDRLLIETDAPFLTPEPHRGKRNEPCFVGRVAEVIAQSRGLTTAEVADATTKNAARLFGWPLPASLQ